MRYTNRRLLYGLLLPHKIHDRFVAPYYVYDDDGINNECSKRCYWHVPTIGCNMIVSFKLRKAKVQNVVDYINVQLGLLLKEQF